MTEPETQIVQVGDEDPADIPEDYYTEIAVHTSRPIVFTEIGWPSAPLASAPDSAYGGSLEEQVSFVHRFFDLTADTNLALAVWAFPHDLGSASPNAAMDSISLRQNDGTPKPALVVWQEIVKLPDAKRQGFREVSPSGSFRAVTYLGKKPERALLTRKLCLRRGLPPSAMSGFAIQPYRNVDFWLFPVNKE